MQDNTLKQKLEAGKAVFGVMITFPSAPVVEMLGCLGFDWALLDNEHGSITVDNSEDLVRAAELSGIAPIVRPVGNKPEIIAPFLDRGAWGVQVPHVNTAAEARAAVDAVKYYPEGHRGIFSRSRPAGYGFTGATADYVQEANRNTLVCLMLEEVEAINNLEELVTVDGVDVFFIGSGDLSQSMGYPGQQTHPGSAGADGAGGANYHRGRPHRRRKLPGQPGAEIPGPGRPVFPRQRRHPAANRQRRLP